MVPLVGSSNPAISRSIVVLPEPDGPSSEKNSPRRDVEVDRLERDGLSERLAQLRSRYRRIDHRLNNGH